jgi:hypothetical protein
MVPWYLGMLTTDAKPGLPAPTVNMKPSLEVLKSDADTLPMFAVVHFGLLLLSCP